MYGDPSISAPYGDYFRLLHNGEYTINATVRVPDADKNIVELVRSKCIRVENEELSTSAMRVDFDFTDTSVKYEFDDDMCKEGKRMGVCWMIVYLRHSLCETNKQYCRKH